jgi:hypothetical protein
MNLIPLLRERAKEFSRCACGSREEMEVHVLVLFAKKRAIDLDRGDDFINGRRGGRQDGS